MKELPPKPSDTSEEYEREIFAAELGGAPSVDLHGRNVSDALSELESFFHSELMKGIRVIKVIHGRGTGKLRAAIGKWIEGQKGLVLYSRDTNDPRAQGGVTYIVLESIRS